MNSLFVLLGAAGIGAYMNPVIQNQHCLSYQDLFVQQEKSIVRIYSKFGNSMGVGTGFISNENGQVITSAHVVNQADKIIVEFHDGKNIEYKHSKMLSDDSISKIVPMYPIKSSNFSFINIKAGDVHVGESVYTIGYPYGMTKYFTHGYVAAVDKKYFILSMPVYQGMSGSPVFNCRGEIIGFVLAVHQKGNTIGIINKYSDLDVLESLN